MGLLMGRPVCHRSNVIHLPISSTEHNSGVWSASRKSSLFRIKKHGGLARAPGATGKVSQIDRFSHNPSIIFYACILDPNE